MDNFASERSVVGSDRNSLLLCGVPVLGDLTVLDAEHVEPGSRVRLRRVLRISKLPHEAEHDDIPFRRDGDKSGGHLGLDRLRLFELGEELYKRAPASWHIRVVLDVRFSHVFVGEFHVTGFEYLAPEVVDKALVLGQFGIGAGEKGCVVRVCPNGHLGNRCRLHCDTQDCGGDELM